MNFKRAFAVTKRVFKNVKNDKRTLGLMLFAPILVMLVFGVAFSGDISDVNVIIVNNDQGLETPNGTISLSKDIISNLNTTVMTMRYMDNEKSAITLVENGEEYAVIIFPKNFTTNAYSGFNNSQKSSNTYITLKGDDTIPNIKNTIQGDIISGITTTMEDKGVKSSVSLLDEPIYGKDAKFIDFFVPGVMAFAAFLLTTLLTLLTFVSEKTSGTLERLLSTPISESEIVTGYAIAFGIIGTIQAGFLLTIAILIFDIMVIGNVLLAFLVVALLAIVSQALGILLSSLAKKESQAIQFIPFIILPTFLLSGIFWPIQAIPSWIRPFSYLIPPTYAVNAARNVFLKGWGLDKIWPDVMILIIFAAIFLILAVLYLKKRTD
ncbi:MAG: ABC transporter permease [Methanobacteriaceae archaeon]|nr:ABC transporter permease [Candidatus Methanorudis spinitermitis]